MRFAELTDRLLADTADSGDGQWRDPWAIHTAATERAAAGHDVIVLSIGQEADETTPVAIVDAAIDSLRAGRHHYADVRGEPALREAIADYHKTLTGQTVAPSQCIVYAGAQNALYALTQVLLQPGDEVILSDPYYTTYPGTFSASGARLQRVPVDADYRLDPDAIVAAMSPETRLVVLNSPANPLGTCLSLADYQPILAACVARDIALVLDMVYADIVDRSRLELPHSLPGADTHLISVGSLSKSHRMTGWRVGWAIGPAALATHLGNLSLCMHYGLPTFIMDAAVTALRDASGTPRRIETLLSERRRIARTHLAALTSATLIDSGQGMFMLLDVAGLGMSAYDFASGLLDTCDVAVLPCDGFGRRAATLVRIGLCVDDARLDTACARIVDYCKQVEANPCWKSKTS